MNLAMACFHLTIATPLPVGNRGTMEAFLSFRTFNAHTGVFEQRLQWFYLRASCVGQIKARSGRYGGVFV